MSDHNTHTHTRTIHNIHKYVVVAAAAIAYRILCECTTMFCIHYTVRMRTVVCMNVNIWIGNQTKKYKIKAVPIRKVSKSSIEVSVYKQCGVTVPFAWNTNDAIAPFLHKKRTQRMMMMMVYLTNLTENSQHVFHVYKKSMINDNDLTLCLHAILVSRNGPIWKLVHHDNYYLC